MVETDPKLERVDIRVDQLTGVLSFRYRWEGNDVDGMEAHDEDVTGWSDKEIRDCVVSYLGPETRQIVRNAEIRWD